MSGAEAMLAALWGTGYHSLCGAKGGDDFRTIGLYNDPEALLDRAAEAAAKGANVWWSVHPMAERPTSGRGGNDDVTEVRALIVDADWQAPGAHKANDKLPTEADVRAAFAKLAPELSPSFTVNSGHGFQGYWLLDAPVSPEAGAELHARLHTHLEQLGIDTDRGDLAAILRVPGSINFKTEPIEVTIEETHPERRYLPEYLNKRLPHASARASGSGSGRVKVQGLDKVLAALEADDRHQDAQALRVLCENYGGHHPYIAGDDSVSVCRPDKTAGTSASIGYSTPGVIVMFTSAWTHNGTTFAEREHYIVGEDGKSIVIADDLTFTPSGAASNEPPKSWSEAHVAEMLADDLRGRYLWSRKLGWLRWDGRRWKADENERVLEDIRRWVIALGRRIMANATAEDLRAVASYKQAGRIASLATLARRMSGIAVEPDQLDAHPGILNARNGIVDLETGELRPHDPTMYLTKLAGADYRPDAAHPDVDAALSALRPGARRWLQRYFGHAATGHASEDVVAILDGGGANGKTTIVQAVRAALGDYARPIARELIMRTGREEHPTAYAELHNVRLAYIEELPEDGVLKVEVLKSLSGGGEVRARYMHKDAWTFMLTHSLLVATNHRPRVLTLEDAVWRRLRLVPFPFRYSGIGDEQRADDRPKDLGLRDRVRRGTEQREAVLAWIIAGARDWYANGIGHEPEIATATAEWKLSEDVLGAFLVDCLLPALDRRVSAKDLYSKYRDWTTQQGNSPLSQKVFGRRFIEHQTVIDHKINKLHTSIGDTYVGLRLRGDLETIYRWGTIHEAGDDTTKPLVDEPSEPSEPWVVNHSREPFAKRFTNEGSQGSRTPCPKCRRGTLDDKGWCGEPDCAAF